MYHPMKDAATRKSKWVKLVQCKETLGDMLSSSTYWRPNRRSLGVCVQDRRTYAIHGQGVHDNPRIGWITNRD